MRAECLIPGCGRHALGTRTKRFCAHHMAKLAREDRAQIHRLARCLRLGVPRRYTRPVEAEA